MDESSYLVTRVVTPPSEISDDSQMTHKQRAIEIKLKITSVFLSLQEKACLLTRQQSHDSDSSIHYCKDDGGDLAYIPDKFAQQELKELIQNKKNIYDHYEPVEVSQYVNR